jgi:putative flippase GtrA
MGAICVCFFLTPTLPVCIASASPSVRMKRAVVQVESRHDAPPALTPALGKTRQPWRQSVRRLLFRNVVASLLATGTDYGTYGLLVAMAHVSPPLATALGRGVGAAVNFSINRVWTFASHDATGPQLWRYGMVSVTGAGLSAGAVKLLLLTGWDYRLDWLIASLAVSWGWNLPLQKFFVFAPRSRA